MSRACIAISLIAVLMVTGCAVTSRMAEGKEQSAISQTLSRARDDLQCRELTPKVLSKEVSMTPVPEARFTIGVTGCGREATYGVACQEFGEDYKECTISAPGEP